MNRGRLETVLEAIDSANSADPTLEPGGATEGATRVPAALLYGQRMAQVLESFAPDASELLRIAARGQHIERWTLARSDYPLGREGYLAWRRALGAYHAERVQAIMAEAGYGEAEREKVGAMLRKEQLKQDPDTQALEDIICLVFLRWYAGDFLAGKSEEDIQRIVAKTARKMSAAGRSAARDLGLPEAVAPAFAERSAA